MRAYKSGALIRSVKQRACHLAGNAAVQGYHRCREGTGWPLRSSNRSTCVDRDVFSDERDDAIFEYFPHFDNVIEKNISLLLLSYGIFTLRWIERGFNDSYSYYIFCFLVLEIGLVKFSSFCKSSDQDMPKPISEDISNEKLSCKLNCFQDFWTYCF